MKFAATKLITSKSQTKSKIIPNQELSISPKFNGKKRCSKASKTPTAPTEIFLVNSFGDLEVQKNKCVLGPNFPQVKSLPPQKKNTTKTKVTCSYEHRFCPKRLHGSNKNTPPTRSPRLMSYVNSTNDLRIALHLGLFWGATGGGRICGRMEV